MKKRFRFILPLLILSVVCFVFAACGGGDDKGGGGGNGGELSDITGITFVDASYDYDGAEKQLVVGGTLPSGVSVSYMSNKGTNAGTYSATATLSGASYNTLTLNATLTINKATITGVTFVNASYDYDGAEKQLVVGGTLPSGVSVSYMSNKGTNAGTYSATATLSGASYNTLTLNATLTINSVSVLDLAELILTDIFKFPDAWAFLPDSFKPENRVYTGALPINFNDGFINVSAIPTVGVGKQMNVVYDTLFEAEALLSYVKTVHVAIESIITAYQSFIDSNPSDYKLFEGSVAGFGVKIELTDTVNTVTLNIPGATATLSYDTDEELCSGKIHVIGGNTLKYETGEGSLKLALSILNVSLTQLEFVEADGSIAGYLYECVGIATANIKTSAVITVDENYTRIMSNKRETDDLLITGDLEVYDNSTGKLVGSEIRETVKVLNYDTLWFNLWDISGITSVKKADTANGVNLDTMYVNGSANAFTAKKVSLINPSRRYDIEMKVMYFYKYNAATEKYEKSSMEIPMMFVQKEQLSTFSSDVYAENKNNGVSNNVAVTLSAAKQQAITVQYDAALTAFNAIKESVSYTTISAYLNS